MVRCLGNIRDVGPTSLTWVTSLARVKRQEGGQPDVSVPSMTDAEGNVVPFDSSGVFKAASEGN